MLHADILISILGWGYFFAWSLSFYGQLILNYELKSVEGMNLSYLHINIVGFSFYSIYCIYGYINKNSLEIGNVNLEDLLFAVHALVICLITFFQTLIYPRGKNTMNPIIKSILISICCFCFFYGLFTKVICLFTPPPQYSIFNIFGYLKLANTFVKYLPQVFWNFQRKSTAGFAISGVILDITGGVLLLLQMGLEHIQLKYHLNPVKILLALISIAYNIVFLVQNYCLYPQSLNFQTINNTKDQIHFQKQQFSDKVPLPST